MSPAAKINSYLLLGLGTLNKKKKGKMKTTILMMFLRDLSNIVVFFFYLHYNFVNKYKILTINVKIYTFWQMK
jgi:hypothetical protein